MAPPDMCLPWVEIGTGDSEGAMMGRTVVVGPLPPVRVGVRTTVDEGGITVSITEPVRVSDPVPEGTGMGVPVREARVRRVDVPLIMPGVSETHVVVPGAIHVPFTMGVSAHDAGSTRDNTGVAAIVSSSITDESGDGAIDYLGESSCALVGSVLARVAIWIIFGVLFCCCFLPNIERCKLTT